ncbi:MAG: sigma-70 family RNA polymerase sigma factor [candidate division Zixibacteria bacterium]|jgi:RNA polymerase sigma-70 factor (ECF subfamily)|nr:sigma-70 family RNA polymerase sigma factor [candidate division Zixibacteria bacterium]
MGTVDLDKLVSARSGLLAYIRMKLHDHDLAEDILQESLLKAVRAAPDLRDEDKLLPWFHRIVRNAIIDAYRARRVQQRLSEEYRGALETLRESESPEVAEVCECLAGLLPTLRPDYARLIESLELADGDPEALARELGISRNNLKVRRHRARRALRRRLEETCRLCAAHGCLDCSCKRG